MSFHLHYVLPDDEDTEVDVLSMENTQGGLLPLVGDQVCLQFRDGYLNWRKVVGRGHLQIESIPHIMLRCEKLKDDARSF